jgi:hypothetical protein
MCCKEERIRERAYQLREEAGWRVGKSDPRTRESAQ